MTIKNRIDATRAQRTAQVLIEEMVTIQNRIRADSPDFNRQTIVADALWDQAEALIGEDAVNAIYDSIAYETPATPHADEASNQDTDPKGPRQLTNTALERSRRWSYASSIPNSKPRGRSKLFKTR